jgi:hypothetical protein
MGRIDHLATFYSTVTLLARFLGLSTLHPRTTAINSSGLPFVADPLRDVSTNIVEQICWNADLRFEARLGLDNRFLGRLRIIERDDAPDLFHRESGWQFLFSFLHRLPLRRSRRLNALSS